MWALLCSMVGVGRGRVSGFLVYTLLLGAEMAPPWPYSAVPNLHSSCLIPGVYVCARVGGRYRRPRPFPFPLVSPSPSPLSSPADQLRGPGWGVFFCVLESLTICLCCQPGSTVSVCALSVLMESLLGAGHRSRCRGHGRKQARPQVLKLLHGNRCGEGALERWEEGAGAGLDRGAGKAGTSCWMRSWSSLWGEE